MKNKSNYIINKILFCALTAGVSFAPTKDATLFDLIGRLAASCCEFTVSQRPATQPNFMFHDHVDPATVAIVQQRVVEEALVPAIGSDNSSQTFASTAASSGHAASPRGLFVHGDQGKVKTTVLTFGEQGQIETSKSVASIKGGKVADNYIANIEKYHITKLAQIKWAAQERLPDHLDAKKAAQRYVASLDGSSASSAE